MKNSKSLSKLALPLLFLFLIVSVVQALTLNGVTPAWSNITGSSGTPDCLVTTTVGAEQQVRYGDDNLTAPCPSPGVQSGFGFEGGSTATFTSGQPFVLGELTHYNNPVIASSLLRTADLDLTIDFGDPVHNGVFTTTVALDETANNLNTCPFGDTQPCADRISVERRSFLFTVGAINYQFEVLGLIPGTLGSCTYDQSLISTNFISDENASNSACLFGSLTQIGSAELVVTKEASVTQAQAGDIIDYRIDYNCFSTTTNCTGVVITDALPDEVVYVGSTGSTHTTQPTGTYSEDNHSVIFNFISPMPAGSTGFVRVRVQVRNDGTVPDGELIENTAIATLTNGPTSTTVSSIPAVAFSNWNVVKTGPATVYLDTDSPVTQAVYTVGICPAGSTVNLLNAVMVDTLPDDAVFISASGSYTYDAGPPQTLTWNLGDISANGGCVNRTVTLSYPEPPFTNGQIVTNTVDASGDPVGEPPWTDTASVSNPLARLIPDPRATLDKAADRSSYVVGAMAQFRLFPTNTGNVPLQNFTVTDTLPPQLDLDRITVGSYSNYSGTVNIRYQASNNPGVWVDWPGSPFTPANQTLNVSALGLPGGTYVTHLQWQYGTVQPGFATTAGARIYAEIMNPDQNGDPVSDGDTINNTAELTWDYPPGNGGSGISGSDTGSAGILVVVMPSPLFQKYSQGGINATWRFLIGQQVGYYVLDVLNNSGVALDDFTMTDDIPPQFEVTGVTLGSDPNYTGQITMRYATNNNPTLTVWPGSPFNDNNQTLNVSALGLASGEYITQVQWDYGTIPVDFDPTPPRILGRIIDPDRNGDPVDDGDTLTNDATVEWTYQTEPDSLSDSQTDTIRQPIADPSVQKSVTTTGPYIPTSVVRYQLRVGAQGSSPSVLINPIVMELLPVDLEYVPGSWTFSAGGTGAPAPNFEEIPNYNGTGRTLLRWSFTGTAAHNFPQGQNATITFDTWISAGANMGSLVNEYYVTSNDVPLVSGSPDTLDLDGDGAFNDLLNGTSTSIAVDELVGLDSVKGVRGQLDTGFSVYPDTGRTIPNGAVTYRLSVINEGNIPINNVRVVDILPFVGDTGVQDLSPRDTQWRPVLTGLVAAPSGVTVYYSTSGNPCRPEIVSSGPAGCTAPNWSTLPPADISTVRSLRFDFAGILDPGEAFNFTWTMQAPPDAPEGEIAWNSFAFTSTNATTGRPLRPAEPNKVGIEIELPVIAPLIQLVKYTNGDDANLPTGPLIQAGDPVTWTYVITNTGNTRLANVTLTDDIIGAVVCNEGAIPNLDPGDDFTCTVTGVAIDGQYVNIGTVEGTPVDASDDPLLDPDTGDPLPPVTDEDPSHYLGFDPTLGLLGDRVWIDANNNGVQDGGEIGLPGIVVRLLDDTFTVITTTTTNGSGNYYFTDLPAGDYYVEFVLPSVYTFTAQDAIGDDTADSDANPTTGRTALITLAAGQTDLTWDAGVIAPASIGDRVWLDSNNNGIQDNGEAGVPNITVNLLDDGGTIIATTYTDEDGIYRFLDLPPGNYSVEVVIPAGYTISPQDAGGDDALDSDVDATGRTIETTLDSGENDPNWDAGLVPLASIGNFVWVDMDNDGIQDIGESGLANVTVTLYDSSDTLVDTTTTNSFGNYIFDSLPPGDYYIVVTLPPGYQFSPQDQGANNSVDSDVNTTTGRTITTTLSPDEDDMTWDAGLVPLASIGDRVWLDSNNNGVQDGGESGFPGITVNLRDSTGTTILATDVTDGSGNYLFDNLPPGNYLIEVIPPADHVFSPRDAGSDSADSDVDRTTGRTTATTLSPDEDDLTWDAGLVPDASIGNYVWYDTDNDGVQDGGELPAVGVTVNLLDNTGTVIDTTTTDGSGLYLFDHLTPAVYAIEFEIPATYAPARRDQGGDDALDSDPHRFTGRTINTTLDPDEDDMTWDMGLVLAASIGDFVWLDDNGNGVQDGGEPGVENVTVRLLDSSNTVIDTTTTDTNGFYSFVDLPPDDYRIEVVLPGGYIFSVPDQGGNDAADSDVNTLTGRSPLTTLDPDEDDLTWDAGLVPVASLGDYVWRDNDNDGIQDAGEPGIPGITVNLYDSTGTTLLATDTTDASGLYLFSNLRNGDYIVEFVLPATGYIRSPQDTGGNDALDSDADITTGRTALISIEPDEHDMTWDAGLTPLGSIGNRTWRDNDMDGVQDGGEPNYAGVTVNLYDSTGTTLLATDVTDANGLYLFDQLPAGDYIVEFVLPASTMFSPQDVGSDAADSDANTTTGRTALVNLAWGENDDTVDAGIIPLASIGDRVWYDSNDNGVQNTGEPNVAGVVVNLYTGGGVFVATDTTDASGIYGFANLVPGNYFVEFILPADHYFSRRDVGSNNTDSDPDRTTGRTATTNLAPGENDLSWDAGIMEEASLGNYVWYDADDDGIQDGGEPGVENVTVQLYDSANTLIATDTTDVNGLYLFENLVPGDYYVIFTLPADHVFSRRDVGSDATDSDPDRATGRTINTTLSPGEDDLSWDAGIMEVASLGDFVWNDANDNGIQDGGEAGVPGVTVQLFDSANTLIATDITDASGNYLFDNLVPGDYYVIFTAPAGYVFSRLDQGGDDALDSDANRTTGRTINTTLLPGEDDLSWDAGLMQVASLGNYVWEDLNIDGIQDGGEPPIPNVTVNLYNSANTLIATDTTDVNGLYLFDNLVPGDYYVDFVLPTGYFFSPQDSGADDAADSDADTATGETSVTTLLPGENDLTWDAGMYRLASISNFAWEDTNANGLQDAGETTGVPGVTVTLFNGSGVQVGAPVVTGANGLYLFDNLVPGDYYLTFSQPAGYQRSPADVGANDAVDSDADGTTGQTATTTLISGENDDTWDAGYYRYASLGDYVWEDMNGNGRQDGGEPPIPNVTVNLYDSTNTLIATDTTDGSGLYLFDNLVPGDYSVEFVLPANYHFTTRDSAAATDATDSDADTTTGRTIATTLVSNENDLTWDAGMYQYAALGDYVWIDTDGDGVQDGTEVGIPGVTVRLYNAANTLIATDVTDASGLYLFENLVPGDYYVIFDTTTLPAGYILTFADQGGDDTADSDPNRTTGQTITTALTSNEVDLTWDAGAFIPASIGDFAWDDLNANGVQDAGEPGLAGVTVTLFDSTNTQVGTPIVTAADGLYLFDNLPPGEYYVVFTAPAGYVFSPQDAGGDDAADSDADTTTGRTINTVLESGEDDPTWDAGLYNPASIGNFVWEDLDADGVQDAGEPGLAGVTVTLFNGAGVQVGVPVVTTGTGLYLFDNLVPGDYYVTFSLPAGYERSPQDAGGDDALDSDADTAGQTIVTTLISNEDDLTWDAGYFRRASLGDFVWVDTDADGIQDGSETGLSGVTVNLYDSTNTLIATDTTDGSGAYLFDNLIPGDYTVEFILPAGYNFSPQDAGGSDATDSDANATTGRTIAANLISGENDLTWDAGMYQYASLGNFVWSDTNADGVQDAGEPGVPGVTVNLRQGPTIVATDITDADGLYLFENLVPGSYTVEFILPTGYNFSPQDAGGNDAADSDANIATGQTIATTLDSGENDLTWDAGIYQFASLGDYVWEDLNADGVQDAGEPPVPGVTVTLFNGAGTQIGLPTTTDASGLYLFQNLVPGDYYVVFTLPAGYVFSPQNTGADDAADSDADTTTGQTATTTLSANENDLTWDAGLYQTASLGDYVWDDLNANGVQDAGEPPVAGVLVTLFNGAGTSLATDTTDINGLYLFDNLVPSDYYVVFTLSVNYVFSPRDAGADDAADSDADTTTGQTITTTLISNEDDLTWDAGIYDPASLGDYVWDDLNANGVQDAGEPPIPGVTVTLFNGAGTQVGAPTTTNASGLYLFDNLVPGDYYVVFTLPTGYVFSPQDAGADDAADSDANTTTGRTATTTLISGENDLTWDAGMYRYASLGDFVWSDTDADGVQDAGEPGVPGVTVTLYDSLNNVVGTDTTNGSGAYLFENLVPGDYYVVFTLPTGYVFSPQDAGADDTADSDADTTTGQTITTTLISGENDLTWDAGIYELASLGDYVWDDLNANGVQDAGEPPVPGVTVTLFNGAGTQIGAPTTTDASGLYLFDNLVPGDYYVVFSLPTGYVFTPQNAGADDAADSDADTTTGQTATTTLIANEDDLTWDAGLYIPASLGDYVWEDLNANGVQDAGEPPIPGVTVTLFNGAGTQVGASTTTDASGLYLFDNLVPGDYYVVFTLPTGFVFSPQDTGADDAADSDANVTTGQTATTTLISGENDLTWDAGMYQYASLGDYVWDDLNANGVQDAGEPPVPGVTVTLFNGTGTQVGAPTTTDASGLYLFDNLVPGDYYVVFTLPVNYVFTGQDAGADDTADSDADIITGRTATTTLISGENDLTWDAGIYDRASLGDYVWDDLNANGVQDAGEPGVPNVTVTLFDGTGTQVGAPTTTDASGFYLFDDLVPGDYYVVFTLPTGYVFSPQDAGADDTADSDADTTTGQTITTTLISGENDLTWDAGIYDPASLGDYVWDDLNANGVQDAGEPPVPGVTVTLFNGAGTQIGAPTTTDASGLYLFDNLVPGDYYVVFTLPTSYNFSPQDAGADDAADSDADTVTGQTATTTLISGENDLTWDAGMYLYASLGDFMWYDGNQNGRQEAVEPPVEGRTVTLYDGLGNLVAATVTDVTGFYLFDNLIPGDYYVEFDPPPGYMFTGQNRGLDDALDSDPGASTGRTEVTALISGEADMTWDAGIVPIPVDEATTPTPLPPLSLSPTPVPPGSGSGQLPPACQLACVNWMLYHTNQTGDWEIFRLGDMTGSLNANLSQGEGSNDIAPSRSPNAEWIVFASDRDENWEIYLAPANGDSSLIRRLTFNTVAIDTDPVWGPGNYVVFESTRTGNWDLFLMDMTTGAVRQLTTSSASDINAYWSPDGSRLIFQSDRSGQWQIYELELGTMNVRLLSDGQGIDLDPQYSNGGAQIAFRSYRDGSDSVLYLMNADGSGVMPFSDLEGDATDHSWSPDDSLIAYQSDLDGDLDIYVYEVGTGATRKLTDNDIADYAPTWQCSTTRVVFTSDIVGNPDIYDADALPISAPAIDVTEEAIQLTFALEDDIYPEGAPLEENASREGQLPNAAFGLGQQTIFLEPDFSLTKIDLTLDTSEVDWRPIDACTLKQPFPETE